MARLLALDALPSGIFWSAPSAMDGDFTAEDPLALDYLGQQVGLWLFPGFTTRTSRAQNYAVVLYGLHLAEKAVQECGYPGDDDTRTELFERWERFWALATFEYRKGDVPRGDEDAMRGVRGAEGAWSPTGSLSLDFKLISRQSELGGLGAYLSSLRAYGLVAPGTLRPSPAAREIVKAFWSEPGPYDWNRHYEEYALRALDLSSDVIPRSHGKRLTLAGLGERSRLSALVRCSRTQQQERLWQALFVQARDGSTLPLAEKVIAAHGDGVVDAEPLLEGMAAGRWGDLGSENQDKVEVALAFGRLARILLRCFDRAYGHVDRAGGVADVHEAAAAAFPSDEAETLRRACGALLASRDAREFGKLRFHGKALLSLATKLQASGPIDSLEHLLAFHREVHRSRRGGGAWLRREGDKLLMQLTGYNGYKSEPSFPGLKFHVVRQLLVDLGRIR